MGQDVYMVYVWLQEIYNKSLQSLFRVKVGLAKGSGESEVGQRHHRSYSSPTFSVWSMGLGEGTTKTR